MSNDSTANMWTDPDDAPPAGRDWFEGADHYRGEKLVRRGRPKSDDPKQLVSLRLDRAVIERLREAGPGWQTRANEALRKAVGL